MQTPNLKTLITVSLVLLLTACNNDSQKDKKPKEKNPPVLSDTVPLPPVKNPDN